MLKMLTDGDFWIALAVTYVVFAALAYVGLAPADAAARFTS